jgi:hypothetical protein
VSISDERGSGRFCRDILTLANRYFTKKVSIWNCNFVRKDSAIYCKEQTSSPQPTNKQISISNDLQLKQRGIIFSVWQSIKQNLAVIPALFADYSGTSDIDCGIFAENVG